GDVVNATVDEFVPRESLEDQWDIPGLTEALQRDFGHEFPIQQWLDEESNLDEEGLRERLLDKLKSAYQQKREEAGPQIMNQIEKAVLLQVLDSLWREHLAAMDYLRKGIHLRGYAQQDPKNEYKREAFNMFTMLLSRLKKETITVLARGQVREEISEEAREASRERTENLNYQHADAATAAEQATAVAGAEAPAGEPVTADGPAKPETFKRSQRKVGRNEACPCGSGKKYKHCHGRG